MGGPDYSTVPHGDTPAGSCGPPGALFWNWLLYRLRGHTMNLYEVAPWGEPR